MIALILLVLILLICYGSGAVLLRITGICDELRLDSERNNTLEYTGYATAVGIIILAGILYLLGISGYLSPRYFVGILTVLGLLTFHPIRKLIIESLLFLRRWSLSSYSLFEKILLLILTVHALVYLLIVLSPPTYGDGVHYLFPTAQSYVRHHQIQFVPYLFAMRPKNMVLLYVVGFLLQGAILAQLFNYALMMLLNVAVYTTAKRYVPREYALLAVTIVYTMPVVGIVASNSSSEPGIALYGFLAVSALACWWEKRQISWLILAGGFSGFCAGFKVIGLEIPLMLIAVILLRGIGDVMFPKQPSEQGRWALAKQFVLPLMIVLGAASITGLPWYYLTYRWTGTPLYSGEHVEQLFERYVRHSGKDGLVPISHDGGSSDAKTDKISQHDSNKEEPSQQHPLFRYAGRAFSQLFRFGPRQLSELAWRMSMNRDHQGHGISPLFLTFTAFFSFEK